MRQTLLAVSAVAALALAACSEDELALEGDLDSSAQTACDEMARFAADGFPEEGRDEVLSSIAEAAGKSEVADIVAPSDEIANAVGGSATAFQGPLDTLAAACMDHGWEGVNGK